MARVAYPEASCSIIPSRSMISRIAWRTRLSLNGGMSTAMHSGSQPPVWEFSTFSPLDLIASTCAAGRSVIASIWSACRALTCAVGSWKLVIVTVSNHGDPSPRQ